MKKDQDLKGCLYLTYDSFKHILHARRSGEGTDGFLRYMHQEMTYVLRGGHNPNVWMACFEFADHRQIPRIDTKNLRSGTYFEQVMRALELHDGRCRHTVNLWDALYCVHNGIAPLTPEAEHARLAARDDYPDPSRGVGDNMPRAHYVLPQYRAYVAVETPRGVVLFSHTEAGRRQRIAYEQYHERHFFNPAQPDGMFRYWEIVVDPFQVQDKVDCLPTTPLQGEGFQTAYVDRAILKQGHMLREYDLTKSIHNYELFRKRLPPEAMPRKRFSEMTIKELLQHFIHVSRPRRRELGCVDNRIFPGEKPQTEVRVKGPRR